MLGSLNQGQYLLTLLCSYTDASAQAPSHAYTFKDTGQMLKSTLLKLNIAYSILTLIVKYL